MLSVLGSRQARELYP